VAACLLSGCAGAGVTAAVYSSGHSGTPAGSSAAAPARSSQIAPAMTKTIDTTRIAAAVAPAVVNINTDLDALEGGGAAAGTGMTATGDGEIITNNHVVQGADTVRVTISGHGSHAATVIGTDPTADVAVLMISNVTDLPTVHFDSSSGIAVGDPVVAIGNALGLGGSPTVTTGIISATGRTITASDETGSNQETLHGLLQTDAPIAPGNSGGPLVSANGTVIGMDTAAASSGAGGASLGFAIPSSTIEKVAGEIMAHRELPGIIFGRQPFLGVEVLDSSDVGSATSPYDDPFGFGFGFGPVANTPNGTPGVVVSAIDPNSPAAEAGISPGDVITAIDGRSTPTTTALSRIISTRKPGDTVALMVSSLDGTQTVHVKLVMAPID
jgi:S1-C subfamily serine protease